MPTKRKAKRGRKGEGSIRELPSGQHQLTVVKNGKRVTYGVYESDTLARAAQARWILTGLLPDEDPDLRATGLSDTTLVAMEAVKAEAAGEGVRCQERFLEWQADKRKRARTTTDGKRSYIREETKGRGRGAESTATRDVAFWNSWWKEPLGVLLPTSIGEEGIRPITDAMHEQLAPATIRTHLTMIKAFFNWMVQKGYMPVNPIEKWVTDVDPAGDRKNPIPVPDFTFISILSDVLGTGAFKRASSRNTSGYVGVTFQKPRGNRRGGWQAYHGKYLGFYGSREEAASAVAEARGPDSMDRLIFELILGTAGRGSEVAGFRMMDVEMTRRTLWAREPLVIIRGKPVRQPVPKGGKPRPTFMGPQLAKLIQVERTRRGTIDPNAPLVTSPEGGELNVANWRTRVLVPAVEETIRRWAPIETDRLVAEEALTRKEAEQRVAEEAELLRGLRPHHLRHTAVALMIAVGATDVEIQLTLGHADIQTSRNIYMHVLTSQTHSTAARVEEERARRALALVG